jgi:hypothetical protein
VNRVDGGAEWGTVGARGAHGSAMGSMGRFAQCGDHSVGITPAVWGGWDRANRHWVGIGG